MSYDMMESLLVQRIAEVRASEEMLMRSLKQTNEGIQRSEISRDFQQLRNKLEQAERLLSAMDAASMEDAIFPNALFAQDRAPVSAIV